jgi:hypothetical protein
MPPSTPNAWTPTCRDPSPAPQCRDTPSTPHAAPGHRHGHREHTIGAEHHRPFPDPSPRHWPCADPLDQFPEPPLPQTDRARHLNHAEPAHSARAERTARVPCSRSCRAPPASPFTHTRTAPHARHVATPTQPSGAPQPPHRAPFPPYDH